MSRAAVRRKAALKAKNRRTKLRVKGHMKVRGGRRMKAVHSAEKKARGIS